ncbi:MAG: YggS family pyridoxal phosphate-dependent enzyme [Candidatus Omnitrophota bacterium]|nr:YggS family pyridoxal phosphate-dependent enzyme [Candidatus Omnitrophota bacterium]
MSFIFDTTKKIVSQLPSGVSLVAATKTRVVAEIEEAIAAGVAAIGENYVQEAQEKFSVIGNKVKWHLIGHLQKNKAKFAVKVFDMIETLDSVELAGALNKECKKINKIMPVLIEVNSACEPQKAGVLPDRVQDLLCGVACFGNIKVMGLMTMGPLMDEPEVMRPFFKKTKEIFDAIRADYPSNEEWKYLSMGMSDSYKIAIEEGANIVRVGTAIFGRR